MTYNHVEAQHPAAIVALYHDVINGKNEMDDGASEVLFMEGPHGQSCYVECNGDFICSTLTKWSGDRDIFKHDNVIHLVPPSKPETTREELIVKFSRRDLEFLSDNWKFIQKFIRTSYREDHIVGTFYVKNRDIVNVDITVELAKGIS